MAFRGCGAVARMEQGKVTICVVRRPAKDMKMRERHAPHLRRFGIEKQLRNMLSTR